jgi:hypothetical protein
VRAVGWCRDRRMGAPPSASDVLIAPSQQTRGEK